MILYSKETFNCSKVTSIYNARNKLLKNIVHYTVGNKNVFPSTNAKAEHNLTLFLKEVSEVAGSESVNCNDDGRESERLCEPNSPGVCLVGINNSH